MARFAHMQTFEIEFTSSSDAKRKDEKLNSFYEEEKYLKNLSKVKTPGKCSLFSGKKANRNKLFLSKKLANSLKKVRLRRKEKSGNNNFFYRKKNPLINDVKYVQNFPIIPFSPTLHTPAEMSSSYKEQKHPEIRVEQLNVWNIEQRRLENLIQEAKSELYQEN